MSRIVVICDKCNIIGLCDDTDNLIHQINNCGGNLIKTNISETDFDILCDISPDNDFIKAMINLKESDPIEYQLKMSQFKTQVQQQKSNSVRNDNSPKCPICNSTNLSKISTAKKATKVGLFGIFGAGDIGKTWKCNNCGSKF